MLGVRYLVLPHVDRWRPEIEAQLSSLLHSTVQIDDISASWSGLHPALSLTQFRVLDQHGQELLKIPSLYGVVSWTSLLSGTPTFVHLQIDGLSIAAVKRLDGTLALVGLDMPPLHEDQVNHPLNIPAVNWMLNQRHIELRKAGFVLTDESRPGASLALSDITVMIHNSLFKHELTLSAQIPASLGGRALFQMRADQMFSPFVPTIGRKIEFYGELDRFLPSGLQPWLDIPLVTGMYGARAWVEFRDGRLAETTIDLVGQNATGAIGSSTLAAQQIKVRLKGLLADILPEVISPLLVVSSDHKRGVRVTAALQGAALTSTLFEPNQLDIGQLDVAATVSATHEAGLAIEFDKLSVHNSSSEFSLQGRWRAGGVLGLGYADVTGFIQRLDATYLYRYLPTLVGAESRTWLHQAFTSGDFVESKIKLFGDLSYFPFNDCGNFGQFSVDGRLKNINLDYAPPTKSIAGWPVIEQVNGKFKFERLGLAVTAESGYLHSGREDRIKITNGTASIADLYYDPLLKLHFETNGSGQTYLDTLAQTPLADRFGEGLADVRLTGQLEIPVDLVVDLVHPEQVDARGYVALQNESLTLSKDLPVIDDISGRVDFAGETITFSGVRAQMLDGNILVDGSFDHDNGVVQISGDLGAAAINKLAGLATQDLVKGSLQYKGLMKLNATGGIDATVNTNMKGLALNLPQPLTKDVEQEVPLEIRFGGTRRAADQRKSLSFSYGSNLKGRFERTRMRRGSSLFDRGLITYDLVGNMPETGLAIDVALPSFDWDNWESLTALASPAREGNKSGTNAMLPPLVKARLLARHFTLGDIGFSDLDLNLSHNSDSALWSAQLKSRESDGVIDWLQGTTATPGKVTAKLSRLVFGSAAEVVKTDTDPSVTNASAAEVTLDDSRFSDIPSIDLTIDDLTLYGNKLGQIRFKGSNKERGKKWNIDQLHIVNPYATFDASGDLQMTTAERGVRLTTKIEINDVGKLSDYMGYPDKIKEGQGVINADVHWLNFPWVFDYEGLSGNAEASLKNGVFEHLNSRSARLLELLSVQSLQRLFSLNFKPGTVFQNGYPWNSIAAKFVITNGVVSTSDLTIASPVANILLVGKSDLKERIWDMQADVKPVFDMSGTALATGFVVNPFIGIGALVTQYILRNPIEKAFTEQYKVTGFWDDPKLEPLGGGASPAKAEATPVR